MYKQYNLYYIITLLCVCVREREKVPSLMMKIEVRHKICAFESTTEILMALESDKHIKCYGCC
jgi:hypothetical protein